MLRFSLYFLDFISHCGFGAVLFGHADARSKGKNDKSASGDGKDAAAPKNKVAEVQAQVDEVKGIMVENVDKMLNNMERAEDLEQKTCESMALHAFVFVFGAFRW
jgi:hypothetical protein